MIPLSSISRTFSVIRDRRHIVFDYLLNIITEWHENQPI